jgi:hypothetical protein
MRIASNAVNLKSTGYIWNNNGTAYEIWNDGNQGIWQDWTPTITPAGSMTFTSVTVNLARYCVIGHTVFVRLFATGTIGGTLNSYFSITMPVSRKETTGWPHFGSGSIYDGADAAAFGNWSSTSQTTIKLMKYNAANFSAFTGANLKFEGFYEIA